VSPDQPAWLVPREVQELLRFKDIETVYALINSGVLPATKIAGRWRIARADVEALLAGTR
jgi:excisionase family DNA binding protein